MKLRIFSALLALLLVMCTLVGCVIPQDMYFERTEAEQTTRRPSTEGKDDEDDEEKAPTQASTATAKDDHVTVPNDSSLAVHFIDVGQADAALILCDGKAMLIDGGNSEDSSLIYTYLRDRGIDYLDYVVCTHAHEDHVGGLSGALSYADAGRVFAPVTSYNTRAFENFVSKAEERGCAVTVPKAGERFSLGSASVTVLGPIKEYDDPNNTSIVLRVVYGEVSFLFTGDMESDAERDLIDAGVDLSATVLKVGHHGSDTSSSYLFLREVAPTYGVISVGEGNSYGHPNEKILSRYRDADVTLYRTDLQGDIICTSEDGKTVNFTTAKNSDAVTNPTEGDRTESDTVAGDSYAYIGNVNSKKYHEPDCSSLPEENNRIYFLSKEEAEAAGYTPCGRCDP